jgi:WD40 repeat protein
MCKLATLAFGVLLMVGTIGCAPRQAWLEPTRIIEDAHYGGNALAISPDSDFAASGGWAGGIRVWRLPGGTPVTGWRTSHGDLSGLMFLPEGDRLLSTGRDGVVRIWELNGRLLTTFTAGSAVTSFYPGGDATSVLLGHADGQVTRWTVDGQSLGRWQLSNRRITAVATDKSSSIFAASDYAGRVWRWRDNGPSEQLQSPPSHARSLVFSPVDARLLGSGWFDLFSWPVDGIELQVIPTAHRGIVNHLEFIGDGSYVASISRQTDSAILLLDPDTGETLVGYKKHELCGQHLALSPDGRYMISNSDDASVRFYTLPEMP